MRADGRPKPPRALLSPSSSSCPPSCTHGWSIPLCTLHSDPSFSKRDTQPMLEPWSRALCRQRGTAAHPAPQRPNAPSHGEISKTQAADLGLKLCKRQRWATTAADTSHNKRQKEPTSPPAPRRARSKQVQQTWAEQEHPTEEAAQALPSREELKQDQLERAGH